MQLILLDIVIVFYQQRAVVSSIMTLMYGLYGDDDRDSMPKYEHEKASTENLMLATITIVRGIINERNGVSSKRNSSPR